MLGQISPRGLILAACLVASDASAHGGAVPPWVFGALLIAWGGILAAFAVPIWLGSGPLWGRIHVALVMGVSDFVLWLALLWIVFKQPDRPDHPLPEFVGWIAMTVLTLCPWILPAVYGLRARRKRKAPAP